MVRKTGCLHPRRKFPSLSRSFALQHKEFDEIFIHARLMHQHNQQESVAKQVEHDHSEEDHEHTRETEGMLYAALVILGYIVLIITVKLAINHEEVRMFSKVVIGDNERAREGGRW